MYFYTNDDTSEPWVNLCVHPYVHFVDKYCGINGSQEWSAFKAFISYLQIIHRKVVRFLQRVYFRALNWKLFKRIFHSIPVLYCLAHLSGWLLFFYSGGWLLVEVWDS